MKLQFLNSRCLHAWTVLGVLVLCDVSFRAHAAASDDAATKARFAAQGFLANYSGFEFYTCEMRIRAGKCGSLQRAIDSGPETDVATGTANMVVDGPLLYYKRSTDDEVKFDPTLKVGSMQLPAQWLLRGENQTLSGNPLLGGVSIQQSKADSVPNGWQLGADMTTWDGAGALASGASGLFGNYVSSRPNTGNPFSIEEDVEILGVRCLGVTVTSGPIIAEFFVDENRGFIPLKTQLCVTGDKNTPMTIMFVTDIQQCSQGRWFPMRAVAVSLNGAHEGGNHHVREIVVTHVDADQRPSRDAFSMELPAGMSISDPNGAPSQYTLHEKTTVTLANLPMYYERISLKTPHDAVPQPAKLGVRGWLIAVNIALIALLLLAYFVVKYRSQTVHERNP